jgi:hypothetical protein
MPTAAKPLFSTSGLVTGVLPFIRNWCFTGASIFGKMIAISRNFFPTIDS